MTVYSWPDTRAFQPQGQELRVVDNTQRTVESSLSGYVQTNSMPGARWAWGLDMAPDTRADRAALEAYLLRLSGRQHRVRLWDMRNPRPRGSIQLTGVTLGATAAQFATTLPLAGCATSPIQAPQGLNTASWFLQGCTIQADINTAPDGTDTADAIVESVGDGGGSGHGVRQSLTLAAGSYAMSWSINAIERTRCSMWHYGGPSVDTSPAIYDIGAMSVVGSGSPSIANDAAGFKRCTRIITLPTAGTIFIHIGPQDAGVDQAYVGDGTSRLAVWGVQIDPGVVALPYRGRATLLAGDWLGLTGGQLVRVVVDATATDAGAMTVEVRHMLRSAVASGSAVTLDKPTALYVRTEAPLTLPRMPGSVEPGLSIDLVEVFS